MAAKNQLSCLNIVQAVVAESPRTAGAEFLFRCPRHDDQRPSLSVNAGKNVFFCGPCNASGGPWQLASFLSGINRNDKPAVTAWLREHGLLNGNSRKIVAIYEYQDAQGKPIGRVVRASPKGFYQEKPDGKGGWEPGGFPPTLYRLPDVMKAEKIHVVEGEKDVDCACTLGITATCNPMGAGKWRSEYSSFLRGRDVIVIADNDAPGSDHGRQVASSLIGLARSVKLIEALPTVKDLTEFVEKIGDCGRSKQLLTALVEDTSPLTAADIAKWGLPKFEAGAATIQSSDGGDVTEDGLALAFTDLHLNDLRYTAARHTWHRWDGHRWKEDATVEIFDLSRKSLRQASDLNPKNEKILRSGHTVATIVTLAQSDQRTAMTVDRWDRNDWLLNTPNGMVHLGTGKLISHDPSEYITKITAVGPDGDCPIWKNHIDLITRGDRALAEYLQRWAGYSLTGSTKEEALAFFHGTGGNGKDAFVTTLQKILGDDYARTAPMTAFTASKTPSHPTDLAGLHSARLVLASETAEASRWDEEKIKLITGGGIITARFMRGDFFDFIPKFKIIIMGNHKPALWHVDDAVRRRFHLVPFKVNISNPVRGFKDSLRQEWPEILSWAIQGCLAWHQRGLDPPPAVIDATDEYFSQQDTVARWLEERCKLDANAWTGSTEAYEDWKFWTERQNEFTGQQKQFSQKLMDKGFRSKPTSEARGFLGFSLRHEKAM